MSLSPRGASAIPTGQPGKAALMMLVSGVLAWVTGLWWISESGTEHRPMQLAVGLATLAVLTVPTELVGGRASSPRVVALCAAVGFGLPWMMSIAVARDGEGVFLPALGISAAGFAVVLVVAWATRRVAIRWGE